MAGGTKISELIVTQDTSGYEAGSKRLLAADDAIIAKSKEMAGAVEQAGASVDAAGTRIGQTDQKLTATVSSFERLERQLRTSVGANQLYETSAARVNAVVAKHPELAERGAAALSALADKYLGTGRSAAQAAALQAVADAKAAKAARESAAAAQEIRDRLDPAAAAQRAYAAEVQRVTALVQSGALLEHEGAAAIAAASAAREAEILSLGRAGAAYESTAVHAGSLIRETRAVFDELSSGRSKQAIGSLTLLFTRGLGVGFGPFLGASAALAIPAAVILSVDRYQQSLKQLDLVLGTTGRTLGLTRDGLLQIVSATQQASGVTASQGRGIVDILAGSSDVGAGDLAKAAAMSRDFGAAMGTDATQGAQALARALADPAKGLSDLDARFGIADLSLIQYVHQAEAQGDVDRARGALLDALAPKLTGLADNQLSLLGRGWKHVADAASEAWDVMGRIGSDETLPDRIKRLQDTLRATEGSHATLDNPSGAIVGQMAWQNVRNTPSGGANPDRIRSALDDAEEQQRRQNWLASSRAIEAQQRSLANGADALATKYDAYGAATRALTDEQVKLGKTLDALKATGQASGPVFDTLARAYSNMTAALADRSKGGLTDHELEMRGLAAQADVLSLSPGQRGAASAADSINLDYTRRERDDPLHRDDLEAERLAKLSLATKTHAAAINDETAAMLARTQASAAYADALGRPGLSAQDSLTAGYLQQARSAGTEAARTGNQDAGWVAQNQLHLESTQGLAEVTEATNRLRMETDLLSQSDTSNASAMAAANRAREAALLFAEPLAKAAADEAEAWTRGDMARVASAQRVTDALRAQQAIYRSTAQDRDEYQAAAKASAIGDDLNDQLQMAQFRQQIQPLASSHNPDDQISAARQIAELQERLSLQRQFGPVLDEESQHQIALAGDIAEVTEQTRLMGQEQKNSSKAIDAIGDAGMQVFEQLTTSTGRWHDRVHQALTTFEDDIARILDKLLIFQPLEQALGGGSSGSGAGGGLSGMLSGVFSSLFGDTSGGVQTNTAYTDTDFSGADTAASLTANLPAAGSGANLGAASNIPGYAGGGDPALDQLSLVGEEGPELFMPKSAGTIIPAPQTAAVLSGGGNGGNSFAFHLHGGGANLTRDDVYAMLNQAAPNLIKSASLHAQGQIYSQIQRGGAASKLTGRRPL